MPESTEPDGYSVDAGLLNPLSHGTRESVLTSDQAWLQAMVDAELAPTRTLVDECLAPEWMSAVCDPLADASQLDLGAIAAEALHERNHRVAAIARLAAGTPRHRDERPHPRPAGLRSWARCTSLRGRSKDDRGISRLAVFLIF